MTPYCIVKRLPILNLTGGGKGKPRLQWPYVITTGIPNGEIIYSPMLILKLNTRLQNRVKYRLKAMAILYRQKWEIF